CTTSRESRDTPAAVNPRTIEIASRDRCNFPGVDVDEVTLEVERAAVSVDGGLELVRRMVGPTVRLGLECNRLQPDLADLLFSRDGLSRAERARRIGCEQADHLVDVLLGYRLVEGPLDLADLVVVDLTLDGLLILR